MSFAALLGHLALAINRTARGKTVEPWSSPGVDVPGGDEADAVCQMAEDIRTLRGVVLNPSEICFYTRQVLGAKVQRTLIDLTRQSKPLDDQPEIFEIVESIASEASLYLHPSLKVDQQLQRALYYHLQVAVMRLRYNLPIQNPLLGDIEAQYPQIFRVAQKSVGFYEKKVNRPLPSDEIASIAMHLAASMERLRPFLGIKRRVWIVCGEGVDSAWLLVARLHAEFSELEVVEVTSALEISRKPPEAGQADAVLATVPVNIPGILTLIVSPLLSHDDIARIYSALEIGPSRKILEQAAGWRPGAASFGSDHRANHKTWSSSKQLGRSRRNCRGCPARHRRRPQPLYRSDERSDLALWALCGVHPRGGAAACPS